MNVHKLEDEKIRGGLLIIQTIKTSIHPYTKDLIRVQEIGFRFRNNISTFVKRINNTIQFASNTPTLSMVKSGNLKNDFTSSQYPPSHNKVPELHIFSSHLCKISGFCLIFVIILANPSYLDYGHTFLNWGYLKANVHMKDN